mmetsp:Transcript_1/g.2  ORF Transcript_1/g.2 Transcript_1/m.2 type:complete len:216 (-) Transcript_1:55-702(-)
MTHVILHLIRLQHHGLQPLVGVIEQRKHVDVLLLGFHPEGSLDDLVHRQLPAVVTVKDLEQHPESRHVDAQTGDESHDLVVVYQCLELVMTEHAIRVHIHFWELGPEDPSVLFLLLFPFFVFGRCVIALSLFHRDVHENSRQNIQEAEEHETDVDNPQEAEPPARTASRRHRRCEVHPIATGESPVQGHHDSPKIPIQIIQNLQMVATFPCREVD